MRTIFSLCLLLSVLPMVCCASDDSDFPKVGGVYYVTFTDDYQKVRGKGMRGWSYLKVLAQSQRNPSWIRVQYPAMEKMVAPSNLKNNTVWLNLNSLAEMRETEGEAFDFSSMVAP